MISSILEVDILLCSTFFFTLFLDCHLYCTLSNVLYISSCSLVESENWKQCLNFFTKHSFSKDCDLAFRLL